MRSGWLARVGPWVGLSTSPVALVAGGGVAEGLKGIELVAALVVGSVILSCLAGAQGLLGQRTGLPLASLTARTLGSSGSRWVGSMVMLVMMLGWFGVNAGIAGVATGRLLHVPDLVGIVAFAAIMLLIAARGLGVLSWISLTAGAAATALAAYGMQLVLTDHAVTISGGFAASQPLSFAAAVTLMVGYGSAFSLRTPDFTHDLPRARHVTWCALWGLCVPYIGFALAGALLYTATGEWDLADALRDLGSSDLAYLFVAVGFTGSVLTNVWSGGLALREVAPRLTPIAGMATLTVLGTAVAAAGLADVALDWLTVMALSAPGLVVLCILAARTSDSPRVQWRPVPLIAWAVGIVFAVGLHLTGSAFALPAAAAVPAGIYCTFGLIGRRPGGSPTPGRRK